MMFKNRGSVVVAAWIVLLTLFTWRTASADPYTYTCYRYVAGHPTGGWITVRASSKDAAEARAYRRVKELGGQVDHAECKY